MWNGLTGIYIILLLLIPAALVIWRGKPMRMLFFFYAGVPLWPSLGTKYMLPGVYTPPDPMNSDPVPTYVDPRPDPELPTGVRRMTN